ncbi:hypothetical protein AGLY_009482 [Aphis glycines]|uniref:Uncharacterized protein n=1 Tax=Aphis glycines TaxID=307491 RepID=A0A6G0TJR6_APHGL|nr:hypothetical protein AGLY_009482 [Aphis glycines]
MHTGMNGKSRGDCKLRQNTGQDKKVLVAEFTCARIEEKNENAIVELFDLGRIPNCQISVFLNSKDLTVQNSGFHLIYVYIPASSTYIPIRTNYILILCMLSYIPNSSDLDAPNYVIKREMKTNLYIGLSRYDFYNENPRLNQSRIRNYHVTDPAYKYLFFSTNSVTINNTVRKTLKRKLSISPVAPLSNSVDNYIIEVNFAKPRIYYDFFTMFQRLLSVCNSVLIGPIDTNWQKKVADRNLST